VHIPKCGGQSIETAFLQDLGLDWMTRAPLLLRPNNTHLLGPPRLAHLLASEYVKFKYVTSEQFSKYYKFAVVRSPYSRVVSLYNYLKYPSGLHQFVEKWLREQFKLKAKYTEEQHGYEGEYHFVRPQVDFVCDASGKIIVDDIFRLEEIGDCYSQIQANSGLKSPLAHVNSSKKRRAKVDDLSESSIATILELYETDFATFGYDTEIR
jgi:hypothetical protein